MNLSTPDITSVVLMGLACWRVASLLVDEAGPWRVFRWFRERAGILHDEAGFPDGIPDGFLAQLFSCVWCLSLWLAPLTWLLWTVAPIPIAVLAVAALAVIVETLTNGRGIDG